MAFAEPPVHPDAVRTYLAQLEVALAGADPALRHDALVDAEAHLRAAVAAGAAPERAVAEYGAPEEIARAYAEQETAPRGWRGEPMDGAGSGTPAKPSAADAATPAAPAPMHRPRRMHDIPVIGVWFDRRAWGALAYFGAVGFVLSLAYFVWAIVVGSLAVGLAPVIVGIPLVVLLLGSARALCLFEGKVVEFFLGVRMPRRTQPVAGVDSVGFWQRIWCWLRDVRSWLSLGYLLGNFPVSVVTFVLTVAFAAAGAMLTLLPVAGLLHVPIGHVEGDDVEIWLLWHRLVPDANGDVWMPPGATVPSIALGLALLTATLWMVRGLGWVYGHVVQAIQVARPQPTAAPTIR